MDEEEFDGELHSGESLLESDFAVDEDGEGAEEDPLTMGFHEEAEPESDF